MTLAPRAFRSRLLRVLAPALVGILALLCGLIWVAAYVGYAGRASAFLEAEIRDVSFQVAGSGTLDIERYRWDEPHHAITDQRSDPLFLQVFSGDGQLLRQSANVAGAFADYPAAWQGQRVTHRHAIPRLHVWNVDGQRLHLLGSAISTPTGDTLGFVQVGRFVPEEHLLVDRLGVLLIALFFVFSSLLIGLVFWSTSRFVQPLERITRFADSLQPTTLSGRVELTADMDRETEVLSRTLNALLGRLEDGMSNMEQFISNAAHELRTPLTVIRGHVEVSLRRERPANEYRETLELVERRLESLANMVSALLLLARLDRSEGVGRGELIRLVDFCQAARDGLLERAEAQGAKLSLEATGDPVVLGQPDLIMRVVDNLLDNALLYGGGSKVHIQLTEHETVARLEVRNGGVGIAPGQEDAAVERFVRGADASRLNPAGTGLGLAIVERIMTLHRGSVEVSSKAGETVVAVTFPLAGESDRSSGG